jgi:hypothetical protein
MSLYINERFVGSKEYTEYVSPSTHNLKIGIRDNVSFSNLDGVDYLVFDGTNTTIKSLVTDTILTTGNVIIGGALAVSDLTVNTLNVNEEITLAANSSPSSTPGTIYYDSTAKTVSAVTGITNVVVQLGQESQVQVINDTASPILNGTPVYASGIDATTELMKVSPANASSPFTSLSVVGLTTEDIAVGATGMVTSFGTVRDFDTSSLSAIGVPIYLDSSAGGMTNTKPLSPNTVVFLGTVLKSDASAGKAHVSINQYTRPLANKSYSFTSNGIGAGIYYVGGFYDAPAAAVNLNQGSVSQTHGSANNAYAAHAFVVVAGAGTVDTGQIGLKVTGSSINDFGVLTPVDSEILTLDIASLSANQYLETTKKWVSSCTFSLFTTSGAPTAYDIDLNYGLCKYEDFGNKDFTVNKIEVVGLAGASDTGFDIHLLKHTDTGWTYHATAFDPGNGTLADWSTTMAPYDNLVNGENFAWKLSELAEFIDGTGSEGVIVEITTTQNNSVQSMDVHIVGEIESF